MTEYAQTGAVDMPPELFQAHIWEAIWRRFGVNVVDLERNRWYSRLLRAADLLGLEETINARKG